MNVAGALVVVLIGGSLIWLGATGNILKFPEAWDTFKQLAGWH